MSDYMSQDVLEPRAAQFVERLRNDGIDAEIDSFRNYMVKIRIADGGAVKIYYSPKRDQFTFDEGELRNKSQKPLLQSVYQAVFSLLPADKTPSNPPARFSLEKVEYYYQKLLPYRTQAFDFITLANALAEVTEQLGYDTEAAQVRQSRYQFNSLEATYSQLKKTLDHDD